jgi:predicted  nucleic acid-binding Zn-ribbon protein
MKLLFCPDCGAVFSLSIGILKTCDCGKVSGQYVDRSQAEVNGQGISLAIGNGSLQSAIINAARAPRTADAKGVPTNRDFFKDHCRVEYCWVRPHEGEGNPHTRTKPTTEPT